MIIIRKKMRNFVIILIVKKMRKYVQWISPIGNSGCLPPAESQLRQSRATQTYGACWVVYCFHNPPNPDMDYRVFNVRTQM